MATSAATRDAARKDAATARARARIEAANARKAAGGRTAADDDWDASGARYAKKQAASKDAEQAAMYKAAEAEVKAQEAEAKKQTAAKKRKSTAKKATTKAKTRTKRQARTVARKSLHPVAAARTGTAVGLLAGTIGLSFFYLALTNAEAFAKMLDGISMAFDWLKDPTKTIPFKE
jgi:histone H1/5